MPGPVTGDAVPYKVYVALLTQSGTAAPVATVLENTLGGTVVWIRAGAGDYRAILVGAFPSGKSIAFASADPSYDGGGGGSPVLIARISADVIGVATGGDDQMLGCALEIHVYP